MDSGTEPVVTSPVTPQLFVGDEAMRRARRRGRWWGGLTLGGAGLLFASFFLPAINACGSPVIPASIAFEAVHERDAQWGLYLCMAGPAYAFGLLVGLAALLRLFGVNRFGRGIAGVITILLISVSLTLLCYAVPEARGEFEDGPLRRLWPVHSAQPKDYFVFTGFLLMSLLLVYHIRRTAGVRLPRRLFRTIWLASWFGLYMLHPPLNSLVYGLWCWLLTAVAVAVGLAKLLRVFGAIWIERGVHVTSRMLMIALPLTLIWCWGLEVESGRFKESLEHAWEDYSSLCEGCVLYGVLPLLSLLLVYHTRFRSSAWLARSFFGAVWCVVWFGIYLFETPRVDVRYGLWCSFFASLAVMVGLAGEAAALTGVSWFRAAGRLLWGRVGRFVEDVGRCPQCQYALVGQTTLRCPECGRPFEWGEVGLAGPATA